MHTIEKERGSVYCGAAIWDRLIEILEEKKFSKIVILVDENTKKHCLPLLKKNHLSKFTFKTICIPAGEAHKTIATCTKVWQQLSDLGADRNSLLINLGGGVVTDLGGFVASTFKRGIEFINIPTSLLAMVDASVGGKNGVDLGHLKNQIGVIKNPLAVFVFIEFLKTLPKSERRSGYAEMLKHGLIASEEYWESLKDFDTTNTETTEAFIWESIKIKNEVVTKDPTEKGLRKTLNYGHTLGHAIESYFLENPEKATLLHGEAIAVGMVLANYISAEKEGFPQQKLLATTTTFLSIYNRVAFNQTDVEEIIKLLKFDKKNTNGNINFVLLEDFGKYVIDKVVDNTVIHQAFAFYKNFKI
ncbi:3-dehydroquinate synthase [Marinirhabdus gelatinilytica]|uniref:3-dehydroquinate synthase n=1 Tax=Marinirhabdus gelatinilytica TaxID=1703343 RepID=A0A370Q542_9FLAO|nr:3-dehydroquinate synthase [Marinirhabdus gelatinilytica]RDK83487.1 3-dehydroquinate synthase [Marinirhabdus gelatinilytica]